MTDVRAAWSLTLDDSVSTLALSPDGTALVAGSLAGDCVLLDVATGTASASLGTHELGVLAAAWSPDGTHVATGGQDGALRVHAANGSTEFEHRLGGWVSHLAWSPGGLLAASAGRQLTIVSPDGSLLACPLASSTVTAVVWAPNGTRVGSASYGGLSWFDVDRLPTDRPVRRHDFRGSPLTVRLSPDGKWACAGYQDASIHVWPLWSGDDLAMSGYPAKIEHLSFGPDGRWLAAACLNELTWWDFAGKGPRGRPPATGTEHDARITWLGWQRSGSLLATGDQAGTVMIWPSPRSARDAMMPATTMVGDSSVTVACWTHDGNGLAIGRQDGRVTLVRLD